MGCRARLTTVAQQVADALDRAADPAAGVTVSRAYAPDWLDPDFWRDNPNLQSEFTGRRVFVFGAGERSEVQDRGSDTHLYAVAVVVLERCEESEPTPSNEWLDERVSWVESEVYDRLGDPRGDLIPDADAVSREWVSVYSPELLRTLKVFRSEVLLTIRKVEEA